MKKKNKTTVEGKFRFDLEACSKRRDLSAAVHLFDSALSQNFRLTHYHYNALLYLCSASLDASSSQLQALALDHGFRIFDHMAKSGVTPTEATITAVARLAAAKSDGDLAFELVRTMGKYDLSPRLRTYGPALFWFCANLQGDKAWAVEEHMVSMGLRPEEPELAALLKMSAEMGRGDKVYSYLHKLRIAVRSVSESTADIIESWFCSEVASEVGGVHCCLGGMEEVALRNGGGWHGQGWIGKGRWVVCRVQVDFSGQCNACKEQLATVDIDRAETDAFSQSVAAMAMEREVQSDFREFQDWLDKHADFEAIVDGANIGLYQQNFAEGGFSVPQLDAVVKELYCRSRGKWPLVILHNKRFRKLSENASNRKLLLEWLTQGMLYTTPNGSNDDWYWLYAAVKLKCLLVTNDEMRDHIFELLGSSFFLKWKERHQVRYTFIKDNVKLQMPPSYSVFIQESVKGTWHVPIARESSDESSRTWLCITRPGSHEYTGSVSSNLETHKAEHQHRQQQCGTEVLRNGSCGDKATTITGKRKDRSASPSPIEHQ